MESRTAGSRSPRLAGLTDAQRELAFPGGEIAESLFGRLRSAGSGLKPPKGFGFCVPAEAVTHKMQARTNQIWRLQSCDLQLHNLVWCVLS